LKEVQIAGRALVYGFARMNIDGHFTRWGDADVARTARKSSISSSKASPQIGGKPDASAVGTQSSFALDTQCNLTCADICRSI
jgi:hypothetical protein